MYHSQFDGEIQVAHLYRCQTQNIELQQKQP